jgi:ABC-type transport system involved in multi-copper enzyme maturation permease subunit
MSASFLQLFCVSVGLFLVQGVAALPWALALRQRPLRLEKQFCLTLLAAAAGAGALFAFFLDFNSDPAVLAGWGRVFMSILHLQIGFDVFVVVFLVLLNVWSKGAAVALAAFQEGVRQPMFWLLTLLGAFVMFTSVYLPYFTFGEDYKMVKELCYALTMLAPAFFGVVAACISVHEEIEGRTAVTLLSKPISRRQFLLGKYVGISLAGMFMTLLLGWVLVWIVLYKGVYDSTIPGQMNENLVDPGWTADIAGTLFPTSSAADLVRGILLWLHDASNALPGLVIGYCQVLVLVAVAVALATRVPMIVNVPMCFLVFFLGHLTPIMTEVTQRRYRLIHFVAQLFETILPGLDNFDVSAAIIRDLPLDPVRYAIYTANVALYAAIYTAVALLLGLVLFEDRDVA